jgi:hypothetical protein
MLGSATPLGGRLGDVVGESGVEPFVFARFEVMLEERVFTSNY